MFESGIYLRQKMVALVLIAMAIAALPCLGSASAEPASPAVGEGIVSFLSLTRQQLQAIAISPASNPEDGSARSVQFAGTFGAFDFVYDPSQVDDNRSFLATYHDLRAHSVAMREAPYRERLQREVVIPVSTEDTNDLRALKVFSKRDLDIFLSRKTSYLEKLAKVLGSLFLRPEYINRTLSLVNEQFFKHADVVARSNSTSTAIVLSLGVGANFPDRFLAELRKLPLLSGVPERAGFFLGFSVGLAVVHTTVDGVRRFRVEPLAEFSRAEKVAGALLSVNTAISVSTELAIAKSDSPRAGSQTNFISCAGTTLTSSPASLGVSRSVIGIGLPPFGTVFSVIHGKNRVFRPDGSGLMGLRNLFEGLARPQPSRSRGLSCAAIFG